MIGTGGSRESVYFYGTSSSDINLKNINITGGVSINLANIQNLTLQNIISANATSNSIYLHDLTGVLDASGIVITGGQIGVYILSCSLSAGSTLNDSSVSNNISGQGFYLNNLSNLSLNDDVATSVSGSGFIVANSVHDIVYTRCTATGSGLYGFYAQEGSYNIIYNHCIATHGNSDGFGVTDTSLVSHDITYNFCESSYNGNKTSQTDGDGFTTHFNTYHILLNNCITHHNTASGYAMVGTSSGHIYNSIAYANAGNWSLEGGGKLNQVRGGFNFSLTGNNPTTGTGWAIKNNIGLQNYPWEVMSYADLTYLDMDYNNYYPISDSKFASFDAVADVSWVIYNQTRETHSFNADPLFVSSSNFHLLPTSPAINAGVDVGLTSDYDGNPKSGANWDIGAYEFQDSTVPVTTASVPTGIYNSASVTLTCDDGEGVGCDKTYYTTNGDVPITSSTQYSTPISISTTTTLKFFSQDRNLNSETYQTKTYTIDSDAPTLSAGSPLGTFDSGTTSAVLSLTTDETATCKYGTIANTAYASIPNTFTATNKTSHSQTLSNLAAGDYRYYARCQDFLTNTNATDYEISFSIAPEENKTSLNTTEIKIDKKTNKFKDQIYAKKKEIKLQGQDSRLANGLVKIYKNNKLWKTIQVDANGIWSKLLKFKDSFLGSLKIRQYDQYGTLLASQKEKIQVDTEKPEIFTASPLYIKHHGSTLAWTANDNDKIDYYKVAIAGRTIKTKQPQITIPAYAPKGSQMITISAYDRAGNKTSVEARLVVSW